MCRGRQPQDLQTQAEMAYDGLGNRLAMTGYAGEQSITTRYTLDNAQTLLAAAGEKTTAYLYGVGVIGELTGTWSYILPDGSSTPRQLVDGSGAVTLTASYTPWGNTLEVHGTGNFTYGYFGGIMDAASGLLYVGNGQYYDPQTGRFLNRNVNPTQTNPYVPWKSDPAGAAISRLALLALIYRGKRKRNKWDNVVIVLVLLSVAGISLSACSPIDTPGPIDVTATQYLETPTSTPTITVTQGNTVIASSLTPTGTPTLTPSAICTTALTPTPTTTPTKYFLTTELDPSLLDSESWGKTGVTALEVYNYYRDLVEPGGAVEPGWWVRDTSSFMIYDFISLMFYCEAGYRGSLAEMMKEAGVRFFTQRVISGIYTGDVYGLLHWWAEYSKTMGGYALNKSQPPDYTVGVKAFSVVGLAFQQTVEGSRKDGYQEVNFTQFCRQLVKGDSDIWPQIQPETNTPKLNAA